VTGDQRPGREEKKRNNAEVAESTEVTEKRNQEKSATQRE
jgi:hypothetical protein